MRVLRRQGYFASDPPAGHFQSDVNFTFSVRRLLLDDSPESQVLSKFLDQRLQIPVLAPARSFQVLFGNSGDSGYFRHRFPDILLNLHQIPDRLLDWNRGFVHHR